MSIYGELVDGFQIERRIVETINTWKYTYVNEFSRRINLENSLLDDPPPSFELTVPSSVVIAEAVEDTSLGIQYPAVIVLSPGTVGDIARAGDGSYRASWVISIATVLAAAETYAAEDRIKSPPNHRLPRYYCAIWRMLILQQKSLGKVDEGTDDERAFARDVVWLGEDYDVEEEDEPFTVSRVDFEVEIDNVVNWQDGPRNLEEASLENWGRADAVTVNAEPIIPIRRIGG